MTSVEIAYEKAIELAKMELDDTWPTYAKMQERISNLRTFIVTGSRLLNIDAREIPDRYKTQAIIRTEQRISARRSRH